MITRVITMVVVLIFLGLVYVSFYTIQEGQRGLLVNLGQIRHDNNGQIIIQTPGLHFKWPFFQQVHIFDTRLQTLNMQDSHGMTADKKEVLVDMFVKWRVNNIPLYFSRVGQDDKGTAEMLIEQALNSSLRTQLSENKLEAVVSKRNSQILNELYRQANNAANNLGIDVVDVRFKFIGLTKEGVNTIYESMRLQNEAKAAGFRAAAKTKADAIKKSADANVRLTLANAQVQAAKLQGEGDAQAAQIYSQAYSQDPDFYGFYRRLMAYQNIFDKQSVLVLKPDNQFFKYFDNLHE